jgi:hypothetical protein
MRQSERVEPEELTATQLRALAALVEGATVTAAADAAQVHRSTLARWMRSAAFAAALNAARAELFEAAQQRVLTMTAKAAAVVEAALAAGDTAIALAILRGVGVLRPPCIGPTDAAAVQRQLNVKAGADRDTDELLALAG